MLHVNEISFAYDKKPVLNNISFQLKPGEHLSIIGESGSGKSTLLKLIHGEYDLDHGTITWKNVSILGPKFNLVVGYDFMKYVAQEFDLMPFTSVEENVGQYLSNFYPETKQTRISELLEVVELTAVAKTKVKSLSGGQKQRVALARALANEPEILLLDEPFSHIDNFKKQSLRRKLFAYLKTNGIACIVATHDKNDVLGYADEMIVLHDASIIVQESPKALYNHPKMPLIAAFFGEYNRINDTLYYAHQLKVVTNSDMIAQVTHCYFKGHYYLIAAEHKRTVVYFHHHEEINIGTTVHLQILE